MGARGGDRKLGEGLELDCRGDLIGGGAWGTNKGITGGGTLGIDGRVRWRGVVSGDSKEKAGLIMSLHNIAGMREEKTGSREKGSG